MVALTGVSPFLANSWLSALNNTPFVIPICCIQLYKDPPGSPPTTNLSAVTTRMAAQFAGAAGGVITTTGDPPAWTMTTAETIKYIGAFDAFTNGNWLFTAVLNKPQTVAQGDVFRMGGGITLTITGIAGV